MSDRLVGVLALTIVASQARLAVGQSDPPVDLIDDVPLESESTPAPGLAHVELIGGVWLPRLDGQTALRGGVVDLGDGVDLDEIETTLNLELTVRPNQRWHVRATGFEFDVDRRSTMVGATRFGDILFADGDPFEASLSLEAYTFEVGRILGRPRPGDDPWIGFRGMVGVHYIDVEQRLRRPGGPVEIGEGTWWGVTAGLGWRLRYDALRCSFAGGIGPAFSDDVGFVWHVRADITWDVAPGIGAMFGYRLFEVDADDGEYDFQAGLQGLFVGGSIRF